MSNNADAKAKERESGFIQIKDEYNKFYNGLLRQGKINCRDTGIGLWGCSSPDAIFAFFKEIRLERFNNFLDLGSGDGIVVLMASLFTNAKGIEFDKELHDKAIEIKEKLGMDADFEKMDFNNALLSGYDFIFINPDTSFTRNSVEKKLLHEMKGILAVYNNIFTPNYLKKGDTFLHDQIPITVWSR